MYHINLGTAKITCTSKEYPGFSRSFNINVKKRDIDAEISAEFTLIYDYMYCPQSNVSPGFGKPQYRQGKGDANEGWYKYSYYDKNLRKTIGLCGLFTRNKLFAMGIFNGRADVTGDGAKWYGNLKDTFGNGGKTSGGYSVKLYDGGGKSIETMLNEIIDSGYTDNILFSFPKSWGGSELGHVMVINHVIDGKIYYSDSYYYNGVGEGQKNVMDFSGFVNHYSNYGNPNGAAVFVK